MDKAEAMFLLQANFCEFFTWKLYDFDLYKGVLMKKMIQIHQITKVFFSISQIFMTSSNR